MCKVNKQKSVCKRFVRQIVSMALRKSRVIWLILFLAKSLRVQSVRNIICVFQKKYGEIHAVMWQIAISLMISLILNVVKKGICISLYCTTDRYSPDTLSILSSVEKNRTLHFSSTFLRLWANRIQQNGTMSVWPFVPRNFCEMSYSCRSVSVVLCSLLFINYNNNWKHVPMIWECRAQSLK